MEGFAGHQSSWNTSWSPRFRCSSLGSSFERSPHSSGAHPSVQDVWCAWALLLQVQPAGPSQSHQTGTHGGFCHGARRWVGDDACARFSGWLWTQESSPETLLPCPWRWVDSDFGAQSDPGSPPIGQVGLTPSPWSG